MKQLFLTFIFLFALLGGSSAQELTVKSMEAAPLDLSASTSPRLDLNKQPCALVKVRLPLVGAAFSGNVLGEVENRAGVYWVYMSQESYKLQVRHQDFMPLDVNFRDYGIRGVEGKVTYVLTLQKSQGGSQTVDDGRQYLAMSITPKHSKVMIDDEERGLQDGQLSIRLRKGRHHYHVECYGYTSEDGDVELGDKRGDPIVVNLRSKEATLSVSCATAGAQIYINEKLYGASPWTGRLPKGDDYIVEARLAGYHPQQQSLSLDWNESRQVTLPALQAIAGSLDVNYLPLDAEVWLDGKKVGQSPDVFRDISVGRHEVELRKSGYQTKKEQIEIKEGQTTAVSGKLEASAVGQAVAGGSGTSGMDNGHEWVDLGLSVCWATTNVGASKPDEYGDYYAWGETSTKSEYSWSAYKYRKGSGSLTKYCAKSDYGTADNKTVLDASDDVAHVKWGGNWRMPTHDELKELKEKCKWTREERDSHQGYKVTGPNGNSIFLPAAGYRYNSSLYSAGSFGNYWSRTLNEIFQNDAWYQGFSSSDIRTSYNNRCSGRSVRPVRLLK